MIGKVLKSMICVASLTPVLFLVGTSSAQKKADDKAALAVQPAHLIDSIEGPALYKAYCATCHGTDGKGFGPMTEWLKIKAPDLPRLSVREGGKFPLARVQRVIAGEENITAGHGTREMPIWGPVFSQVASDQDLGRVRIYNQEVKPPAYGQTDDTGQSVTAP